jgi:hypothetical protein
MAIDRSRSHQHQYEGADMFEPETERALVAVPLDGTQAELWFKAIHDAYAAQPDSWHSFVEELRITAGHQDSAFDGAFVDAFVLEADHSKKAVVLDNAQPYSLPAIRIADAVPEIEGMLK